MTTEIRSLVTDLYLGFLSRAPDQGGLDYWAGRIDAARGIGRAAVRAEIHAVVGLFESSPEFDARVSAIMDLAPAAPATMADVDVRGNPIPSPSGPAGATMGEQPGNPPFPGGGGGPCGSYEVPVGLAGAGMNGAITRAWLYILEDGLVGRFGNSMRVAIPRGHAVSFRFNTGDYANRPLVIGSEENSVRGPLAARFITLSEVRGDFDYSRIGEPGYQVMLGGGAIQATFNGVEPATRMNLKPNKDYYLNIRCEDAISARGAISTAYPTMGTTIGFS